jgi:hypothetical protein
MPLLAARIATGRISQRSQLFDLPQCQFRTFAQFQTTDFFLLAPFERGAVDMPTPLRIRQVMLALSLPRHGHPHLFPRHQADTTATNLKVVFCNRQPSNASLLVLIRCQHGQMGSWLVQP